MRKPKYRAWDKQHKVMERVKTLHFDTGVCQLYHDRQPNRFFDSFEILEYTGLMDKNNKEICEGDIVKHYQEELFFKGEVRGVVEWIGNDASFGIEYSSVGQALGALDLPYCELEIIGNIKENPELLEVK